MITLCLLECQCAALRQGSRAVRRADILGGGGGESRPVSIYMGWHGVMVGRRLQLWLEGPAGGELWLRGTKWAMGLGQAHGWLQGECCSGTNKHAACLCAGRGWC
jgi:hypothetical protein